MKSFVSILWHEIFLSRPFSDRNSEAGYALFAVLLISMIIMVIGGAISISVHERVRLLDEIRDKTEAYLRAHSAMSEVTYYILTSTFTPTGLAIRQDEGKVRNMNLYGEPIALSKGVTVSLRDVSGMVSPLFNPGYLGRLVDHFSKDASKGVSVIDCLLDWQDRDDLRRLNGAEAYEYRLAGYPYGPRNFYIQTPEEIMLLKGFDKSMFGNIKDDLAYWGTGSINFLTMSKRLLRSILQNDSLVDRIIALRKNGKLTQKVFTDLTGIPSSERFIFGPSGWIRIKVRARAGKAQHCIEAVMVKRETKKRPYMMTRWQE